MASDRYAFIIRLWNEAAPSRQPGQVILRGFVQAIHSDEKHYFQSFEEVPRLLQEITGWEIKDPDDQTS